MASILKGRLLALALMIVIVASFSFQSVTVADAGRPYNRVRQLATDCNPVVQGDITGCGGQGGSGGSSRPRPSGGSSRPRPSGPSPGSSRCQNGCCGMNKFTLCVCCK